ncbi:MAG: hypothetical protein EU529_00540 [Promethearchaeota archaeon]|nr:MAG: hypothetical protein EU529_00540 [Candidatus Lokiarchaeota archaeon]
MSEDSNYDTSIEPEYLVRFYNCPKCKINHNIKIPKKIAEDRPSFPFPFVFLHSSEDNLEDLLTILYLDAQLQIRAVEIIEVENSNIFSETLTKQITEKLMDKIVSLEEENLHLKELLTKLEVGKMVELEAENPKVMSIPRLDYESEIKSKPVSLEPQIEKLKEIDKKPYIKEPPEIKLEPLINVFILSLLKPGEKTRDLSINLNIKISALKETVGNLFGLAPVNFHLSSGGIILSENTQIKDYDIEDGDEIVVIPSRVAG